MGSGTNPGAEAARDFVGDPAEVTAAVLGSGCWGEVKGSGGMDPGAETAGAVRSLVGDPVAAAAPILEPRDPGSETAGPRLPGLELAG